ncbi:unnamed protein product [Cylicocyclus nassatus]|uniref:Uncharacterized protein n=1 Tax=Cylicocyclus nassatus TaxID=53992 RepID=A0AA36H160_CYLNA|nr:unnamed protein product [Cylicocyclus nassatus]
MKICILVSLTATAIAFPSQINSASSEESLASQYERYNFNNYQNDLNNGQIFPSNPFGGQNGGFQDNQRQGIRFGNQEGYGYPRGSQQSGGRRFGQQQNGNRQGWGQQQQNGGNPWFGNQQLNGNNQQLGQQQQNGGYPQFGNQQDGAPNPFFGQNQQNGGNFNPRDGQALEGGLFQGLQNRDFPIGQGTVSGSFQQGNNGQPQQNQDLNQFPFGGQSQQSGFASNNKV